MGIWGWTQPVCQDCYALREPGRSPHRLLEADAEVCVDCGANTQHGIYIRVDPTSARYPTLTKED